MRIQRYLGQAQQMLAVGAAAISALALILWFCPPASADSTVNVSTTSGPAADGSCALQEAVAYAGGTNEPDCAASPPTGTTTVNIPAGHYTVTGPLTITASTVLSGAGASSTTIDGGGAVQVINVATSIPATLRGVTVTGGLSLTDQTGCSGTGSSRTCPQENGLNGGGIANAGALTIQHSIITGNRTAPGVRPFSFFFLLCSPPNCFARAGESAGSGGNGAGVYNTGQLMVTGSTISANTAGKGGDGTDGLSGTGTHASAGKDGGSGGYGGQGGGLYNDSGATATVADSSITGNASGAGGNAGAGSTATSSPAAGGNAGFPGGGGLGGGVYNLGALTITGSTVSGNRTGVGGNGASGGGGTGGGATGSSSGSSAGGSGGGAFTAAAKTVTLANDTFAGNTASAGGTGGSGAGPGGVGGALYQAGSGLAQLTFVTVAQNSATGSGGGLTHGAGGTITEADSVISANTGTPARNCDGTITDNGFNVVFGDSSCPGTPRDPRLTGLAANGGPTQTMAPAPGSSLTNEVPIMNCPVSFDQRGVGRPQGPACDAGAYEVAPPVVTGVSSISASRTAATIHGSVNPNLRDTTVSVNFGTTSAYGSTTTAQEIGAGGSPFSLTVALRGLKAHTLYHYQVLAGNGDGVSRSADETLTTAANPRVVLSRISTSGPNATFRLECLGEGAIQSCSGFVVLTSRVTREGKVIVAVTATNRKPKPSPRKVTRTITLATKSFSVPTGHSAKLALSLNAAGRALLKHRHRLPGNPGGHWCDCPSPDRDLHINPVG